MNEEAILDGYAGASFDTLEELKVEINSILEQLDADQAYCELSDLLADEICEDMGVYEDQEHIFKHRVKIRLAVHDNKCTCEFLPAVDKPEWQK